MLPKTRLSAVDDDGFTLIELLVVILIIGILAAIAIPSFLAQRGKAYDADAKTVARTAQTSEEVAYTGTQAYVAQAAGAGPNGALNAIEQSLVQPSSACTGTPPYAQGACGLRASATAAGYQISVTAKDGIVFTVSRSAAGTITRSCDVTAAVGGSGGCVVGVGEVGSW